MNVRELVATSLLSSHLETQPHESAIDRIGALGRATDLGRALYHWGYAGDESALRSVYKHLIRKAQRRARVYRHHKEFPLLERICKMVLFEWRHPLCLDCGGAGELVAEKLRAMCQTCSGSGRKRYSDGERITALAIEPASYERWERVISDVWFIISDSDRDTEYRCHQQLEWGRRLCG
jgi:hypothetical protein